MQHIERMNKRNKLSYHEYNERYAGAKKSNKRKRGKVRYSEED